MKKILPFAAVTFLLLPVSIFAQNYYASPTPTPQRVIITNTMPSPRPISTPVPQITIIQQPSASTPSPIPYATPMVSNLNYNGLPFAQIKSKIAEAKRQMISRPLATASVGSTAPTPINDDNAQVRIAYQDLNTRKTEFIVISKTAFLTPFVYTSALSSNGQMVTTQTLRANGVNTPIVIRDNYGRQHLPLMIQYPVIRNGVYIETAYYMSTHPGIVTPEVVSAGQFYVRNTIDLARQKLRSVGYNIQPRVADMAERLATVEHVDHQRFRTELHSNIYNDIFTLYALNEGQTYRYSVSSAGAGGMVQMIPSTYRMVRARYPSANLMYDFVEGMRNHVNASQAMLLYMQMTWDDLVASPTVSNALATGLATPEQLMAAGYNSNPARLAGYINRGGAGWTSLIPRETKIYLQIYDSLERAVPAAHRTR